jgi:hypothetical protein
MTEKTNIALLGNMNNNQFSMLRYLRDMGYDAHLYLSKYELSHFDPKNDTWEIEKWEPFIHRLSFGNDTGVVFTSVEKIIKEIGNPDITISSGWFPAYLHKAGINADIIVPFGSDLYQYPNIKQLFSSIFINRMNMVHRLRLLVKLPITIYSAIHQRRAFKMATNVNVLSIFPIYSKAITELNIRNTEISIPMIYSELQDQTYSKINPTLNAPENKFTIISQSRHYWKTIAYSESRHGFTGKGNDRLIEGYKLFLDRSGVSDTKLILFEYGPDVEASKHLIRILGIGKSVEWSGKLPRKIIYEMIRKANIGADQFNEGYYGGTGREILSQGTPLLNYNLLKSDEYEKLFGHPAPPILNVRTSGEIALAIEDCYSHPKKYHEIGKNSKEWFDKYEGRGLAERYAQMIEEIQQMKQKNLS